MTGENAAAPSRAKIGVLLTNLGTPDSPSTSDVRKYLREFLADPRVLDIHPVGRWLLLNVIILPTRPAKSAEAYKKVWTERGSPLLTHGQDLAAGVQSELGPEYHVELTMRYGQPSIASSLQKLAEADVEQVIVVPLYPQYSSSATGSALEAIHLESAKGWNVPSLATVPPFFDHPDFIKSVETVARPQLDAFKPDYVVFSYHGLPERQIRASDTTGKHCLVNSDCCDTMRTENRYCYRAQCYATTRALAKALDLKEGDYEVAFQSRLGRTPWISPYTDVRLKLLPKEGKKRIAVLSPAFVADCLETLEEIAIRFKEDYLEAGGEDLLLVTSLNATPDWVRTVADMVRAQNPQSATVRQGSNN